MTVHSAVPAALSAMQSAAARIDKLTAALEKIANAAAADDAFNAAAAAERFQLIAKAALEMEVA